MISVINDLFVLNTKTTSYCFRKMDCGKIIKIDAEGAENKIFEGAENTFSKENVVVLCCTYHKKNDYEILYKKLNTKGYQTVGSDGFMLWFCNQKFEPPFFRKGLIRAWK